ncbi:MAG: hypothetical protein V1708_03485 [Candidatus Micrarchaeota archaeon]
MPPEKPLKTLDSLKTDIATIDSKISLIAQKIKTIENNQEVLGQTIVMQNEKIRAIESRGTGGAAASPSAASSAPSADSTAIKSELEDLRKQIQEMRYVLNSINPLEFVTVDQVREMIKDKEPPK